ncbi:MAG: hypothetical protein IOB61_04490 [Aquidulcibacter sp.]|nr:hypothetical protein [Aquidulcibacter sp.]
MDVQTEEMLNNRDTLLVLERRSEQQQRQLEEINEKLDRLGFSIEHRDPSYSEYLSHLRDRELLDRHQLTPDQTRERDLAIRAILADLIGESERPLN